MSSFVCGVHDPSDDDRCGTKLTPGLMNEPGRTAEGHPSQAVNNLELLIANCLQLLALTMTMLGSNAFSVKYNAR